MSLEKELSDEEFAQMIGFLRRHAATGMDQWELWKFDIPTSTIYVSVSLGTPPEGAEDMYIDLNHLVK